MADKAHIERVQKVLDVISDSLTRKEFVAAFEKVVRLVLKIERQIVQTADALEQKFNSLKTSVTAEIHARVDAKLATVRNGIDGSAGAQGEPGSEGPLGPQGEPGRDGSPDMAEDIRNKLELLDGDERLDQKAIKGLLEDMEKLRAEIRSKPALRAGRKSVFVKRHNLTSQVDGSTKTFTLPSDTLEVLGVWGTQFPINFNPGTDWTFSGRTLTLTDEVAAPQTGQTLYALIEVMFY